jgi:hypothetical protein
VVVKPTPTPSPTPRTFNVTGSITTEAAPDAENYEGGPCWTEGGYKDIAKGAQVNVRSAAGEVVAVDNLRKGIFHAASYDKWGDVGDCEFDFAVSNVPEGQTFYTVVVSHRGALTYTRDKLVVPLRLVLN